MADKTSVAKVTVPRIPHERTAKMAAKQVTKQFGQMTRVIYNLSGWNKFGLKYDDLLSEAIPEVVEATRRLPQHVQDERNYRLLRANQLCLMHRILPKEEWTKIEDDDHYMDPYIEEIKKENLEKAEWDKKP